jgi:hypothetical protein
VIGFSQSENVKCAHNLVFLDIGKKKKDLMSAVTLWPPKVLSIMDGQFVNQMLGSDLYIN